MLGTRIFTLSLLLGSSLASAAIPEYLPLAVGNGWLYRSEGKLGKDTRTMDVSGTQTIAGRTYFTLNMFGADTPVRMNENGDVVFYNLKTKAEESFLPFSASDNNVFATPIENCTSTGQIVAREEKISVPFGDYTNVLHIKFTPSCADAGLSDAWFLPYIGLLRYTVTTIAGPRTYDLVSSKSGITEVSVGMVSTKLQLDAGTYKRTQDGKVSIAARLLLQNTASTPLTLEFLSGQETDLQVKDEAGKVLYTWSANKLFTAAVHDKVLAPRGDLSWTLVTEGLVLPPGYYTAVAWITASNVPNKSYLGSVAFTVTD